MLLFPIHHLFNNSAVVVEKIKKYKQIFRQGSDKGWTRTRRKWIPVGTGTGSDPKLYCKLKSAFLTPPNFLLQIFLGG